MKGLLYIALVIVPPFSSVGPLTPEGAFADACRLSRYSCVGISPPMVRDSRFVGAEGAFGIYMGGNTIWMAPSVTGARRYVVMVHEMVHYLQEKADGNTPSSGDFRRCVSEEEAFQVSDIVAARLGQFDMIRPLILVASYGCPPPVVPSVTAS